MKLLSLWKRSRVQGRATEDQTLASAVARKEKACCWYEGLSHRVLLPPWTLIASLEAVWPSVGEIGGGITDAFSHCLLCGCLDLSMCGQAKQMQKVSPQSLLAASVRISLGKYGSTSMSSAHLWLCVRRAQHFSLSLASQSCLALQLCASGCTPFS